MRIAMMTNNYKPFVGGVPISIERLADSLRDLGHSVYVFAPDYKSPVDDDEYTFRFPTMKHKIAGAIPIPNLIYGYVKNAISTLDIDLIHVHHPVMIGNVATRIGKEFHIPVVFTYHTRYEQYLHYLTPFGYLQNKANQGNLLGESILDFAQRQVIQRYLNHFLEKCDMVFAPTESIQNYLKPFHIDTPISIAPTGLPPACFENHIEATAIRKKYLQKKQYLFCTVSRLAKEKNLSFLLRGVSAVKKQLGEVLRAAMLQKGFNLILVNSLREAKHRLLEDKEIELILCDLSLPDGTALELFHDIRRISEKFKVNNPPIKLLPFFILTASTDLATEYQYRHEGVSDYITAPVNIPELIRRILFFVE